MKRRKIVHPDFPLIDEYIVDIDVIQDTELEKLISKAMTIKNGGNYCYFSEKGKNFNHILYFSIIFRTENFRIQAGQKKY